MMSRKFLEKWIAELRDPQYKQGTGYLKVIKFDGSVCHCANGVAAEVMVQLGVPVEVGEREISDVRSLVSFDGSAAVLSWDLWKWVDLDKVFVPRPTPSGPWGDSEVYIWEAAEILNDTLHKSLPEIADWLEQYALPAVDDRQEDLNDAE